MSEYITARQQYLNDNEPPMPSNANINSTAFAWHSTLTHTYGPSALSTQNAYGIYENDTGLLTDWAIEKWRRYVDRSTLYWVSCVEYMNHVESFSDVDWDKLSPLSAEPYSLDILNRHSVVNLTLQAANWVTCMKWSVTGTEWSITGIGMGRYRYRN